MPYYNTVWLSRVVAKKSQGTRVIDDIHFRGQEGPLHQARKGGDEGTDVGPLMDRIWR